MAYCEHVAARAGVDRRQGAGACAEHADKVGAKAGRVEIDDFDIAVISDATETARGTQDLRGRYREGVGKGSTVVVDIQRIRIESRSSVEDDASPKKVKVLRHRAQTNHVAVPPPFTVQVVVAALPRFSKLTVSTPLLPLIVFVAVP